MKTITTSRDKTINVAWAQVLGGKTSPPRLVIELKTDQAADLGLTDFDGLDSIKLVDDTQPGMHTVFEGYSRLASVRLTLEKEDGD